MNEGVAAEAVQVLRAHALKTEVPVYGYCVMPDHGHLVIGPSVTCDIVAFVGQFKNLAQRAAWQAGVQGRFWQHSFWDHFLRREESLESVVLYVLHNPVRRGLAVQWRDYPHSGSLIMDLSAL
jgi:REP element-mobilizing transposase RayT